MGHVYLHVSGDIVLPGEMAIHRAVGGGERGGREVHAHCVATGLGVVVDQQSGAHFPRLGTLGLEQGQIIWTWG